MSVGVPVRTYDSVKEKTAYAGPSWKGIRKHLVENQRRELGTPQQRLWSFRLSSYKKVSSRTVFTPSGKAIRFFLSELQAWKLEMSRVTLCPELPQFTLHTVLYPTRASLSEPHTSDTTYFWSVRLCMYVSIYVSMRTSLPPRPMHTC